MIPAVALLRRLNALARQDARVALAPWAAPPGAIYANPRLNEVQLDIAGYLNFGPIRLHELELD